LEIFAAFLGNYSGRGFLLILLFEKVSTLHFLRGIPCFPREIGLEVFATFLGNCSGSVFFLMILFEKVSTLHFLRGTPCFPREIDFGNFCYFHRKLQWERVFIDDTV